MRARAGDDWPWTLRHRSDVACNRATAADPRSVASPLPERLGRPRSESCRPAPDGAPTVVSGDVDGRRTFGNRRNQDAGLASHPLTGAAAAGSRIGTSQVLSGLWWPA